LRLDAAAAAKFERKVGRERRAARNAFVSNGGRFLLLVSYFSSSTASLKVNTRRQRGQRGFSGVARPETLARPRTLALFSSR
jgi:hypothetical protein